MTTAGGVVLLLIAIVILLCEKQEDRSRVMGRLVLLGILGAAVYYIGPVLGSVVLLAISPLVSRVGWIWAVLILVNIPLWLWFFGYLIRAGWLDTKENRAIRAGSNEAFDKRIQEYMSLGYTHEKAIEAALRVRDSKKPKPPLDQIASDEANSPIASPPKRSNLKRSRKLARISALIAAFVLAVVVVGRNCWHQWEDHRFAATHECFNSSDGKVHPLSRGGQGCSAGEEIHERGTPLPQKIQWDSDFIPNPDYKPPVSTGINPPSPPSGYKANDVVPNPNYRPQVPMKADGSLSSGNTIAPFSTGTDLFRRVGSDEYLKSICYDENTGEVSHLSQRSGECKPGSILMAEVK
jgi:hypothetical protein